ncbi:hypothetical protein LCGC14_1038920 [marine sediment metagenome]|uniref:DNA-directed DNA polymerase family A palm domain-containing protein n=1 Tax=marine sediment metagenome TaxID=412755 RepID=A0A0F9MSD0_9ZZZZ
MNEFTVDGHRVILNDLDAALPLLAQESELGFDLETTGFSPYHDEVALVQLYGDDTGVLFIQQVRDGFIDRRLIEVMERSDVRLTGHNLVMFDALFMERQGMNIQGPTWFDTYVAEQLLTPMGRRDISKKLNATIKRRLGITIDKNIEHGGWLDDELTEQQVEYAAQDVIHLHALRRAHQAMAEKSKEIGALEMEQELVPLVSQMSINGLPVHEARMRKFLEGQEMLKYRTMELLTKELGEFNINSPKQVKGVFADVGIKLDNTQHDTFVEMSRGTGKGAELALLMLDVKGPAQRLKMYGGGWINDKLFEDRVHGKYWQCGTDTLRFASSDPNFQQWPKDMRTLVGGMDGMSIVGTDYKQIEVAVAAYLAKDQELLRILRTGEDVHTAIASTIFRIPSNQVDEQLRRDSKEFTFTLLFGGSASLVYKSAVLKGSELSFAEVEEATTEFFKRFEGIRQVRKSAREYVRTPGAKVIRLPNGARRVLVGPKKRPTVLINTTVQGGAAIGLKRGMLEAGRRGLFKYIGAQVHDELVAEVPDEEREDFINELEESMIQGMEETFPGIPVSVETNSGMFWK